MKLSKKTEYALRALVAIARDPASIHTIPQISRTENIPPKFLEQILLMLKQAGLLSSKRGAGGGYTLQRQAGTIRVRDVIELVEGPLLAGEIVPGNSGVDFFLKELEQRLQDWTGEWTVEDLLRSEASRNQAGSFEI
jgi:Rrf2 family protein